MILRLGGDIDLFTRKHGREPVRGPPPFRHLVDKGPPLKGDRLGNVLGQGATKIMPVALHCECCGTDGSAEVEGEDLRAWVATELQCHQRQQHRLSRARWAHNKRMANVTDVECEPKGRRA